MLLFVIFAVFCPGSYGTKIKVKIMLTTVFTWKSEINLIKHDSEGMSYITNII